MLPTVISCYQPKSAQFRNRTVLNVMCPLPAFTVSWCMFSPACYSFINYLAGLQLQAHWDISGAEQLDWWWESADMDQWPTVYASQAELTAAPQWEAAPQSHSHPSVSSQTPSTQPTRLHPATTHPHCPCSPSGSQAPRLRLPPVQL